MSRLVTIFGGSGFVGRYIARGMALEGWRVRVATRRPNETLFVKPYGVVGQVEPVLCNIRNEASVARALEGADAVVNCVGISNETGANSFEAVHVIGAERVARLAAEAGVERLVHFSAITADENSECDFSRTKAFGEAAVLENMPGAVILRPSAVFGVEDRFFNLYAGMTRFGPVLPLAGAKARIQPVFVGDLADAAVQCVSEDASGVYELGGPEAATLRELVNTMLGVIHRKPLVLELPGFMGRIMAWQFDMVQKLSLGLVENKVLTRDQLRGLAQDNVVSDGARGFGDLGIVPIRMATILPDYLWRFRPSGQYDAIKQSAAKLKS